jgi:hypothetical protein
MTLATYGHRATTRTFPEATDRHVLRILGEETKEWILDERINLDRFDYGGDHVVKPAGTLPSPKELLDIREEVVHRLAAVGLRHGATMTVPQRNLWDRTVGAALLELVEMGPFQTFPGASRTGDADGADAWTYLTVHVFPEFARWRFPGKQGSGTASGGDEPTERVKPVDRVRGGRRNVLFRVWYRSFVLGADHRLPAGAEHLSEDELDNIFGRPTIARNHELTRRIVDAIYRNRPESANRNFVVRELMKEIRRRYSSVHFSALGDHLAEELDRLWRRAEARLADKNETKKAGSRTKR